MAESLMTASSLLPIMGSGSQASTPLTRTSYATTPRSNSADLDALLAAFHKTESLTATRQPLTPPKISAASGPGPRRPLCTHMTMKRMHGKVSCNMCGMPPAIGWVYVCTQSEELEQTMPVPVMQPIDLPPIENSDGYFVITAEIAETYRMQPCIIKSIKEKDYTPEQVNELLTQKANVFTTISTKTTSHTETTPLSRHLTDDLLTASRLMSKTGDVDQAHRRTSSALAQAEAPVKSITYPTKVGSKLCMYQACPRCRPFYVDRIYMSIETVLSGQRAALTNEEILRLPLLDSAIMKTIGLRSRPLPDLPQDKQHSRITRSLSISAIGDSDYSSDITPDSATTSDSELDELKSLEACPCPGGQYCPHWDPMYGCAYDNGFDDGLRTMNHVFGSDIYLTRMTPEHSTNSLGFTRESTTGTPGSIASTASSFSLPTPRTPAIVVTPIETDEDGRSFEEVLHHRLSRVGKATSVPSAKLATIDEGRGELALRGSKAASISGVLSGGKMTDDVFGYPLRTKPSSSTIGSEVSVKGGVALTEEAVVHASPDVSDESKID